MTTSFIQHHGHAPSADACFVVLFLVALVGVGRMAYLFREALKIKYGNNVHVLVVAVTLFVVIVIAIAALLLALRNS